jgi:hypothetical protein
MRVLQLGHWFLTLSGLCIKSKLIAGMNTLSYNLIEHIYNYTPLPKFRQQKRA